jgi:hypothetical protein
VFVQGVLEFSFKLICLLFYFSTVPPSDVLLNTFSDMDSETAERISAARVARTTAQLASVAMHSYVDLGLHGEPDRSPGCVAGYNFRTALL